MSSEMRASYTDTFEHAFDAKGRITVPSEWREAPYESRLFVFPSSDTCVKVYPESWLSRLQSQISNLKVSDPLRKRVEDLATLAQVSTWDQQGRITVKEKLRAGAGLKKDSIMVGRLDHFQIWDLAVWREKETAAMTIEGALEAIGL